MNRSRSATFTAAGQETNPIFIKGPFTVTAPSAGIELHERYIENDKTTTAWMKVWQSDGSTLKWYGEEPGQQVEAKLVAGSSFSGSQYVRIEEGI